MNIKLVSNRCTSGFVTKSKNIKRAVSNFLKNPEHVFELAEWEYIVCYTDTKMLYTIHCNENNRLKFIKAD